MIMKAGWCCTKEQPSSPAENGTQPLSTTLIFRLEHMVYIGKRKGEKKGKGKYNAFEGGLTIKYETVVQLTMC